jgi:hypothetical protein
LPVVEEGLSYLGSEPCFGCDGRGAGRYGVGAGFCKSVGEFVARDVSVQGCPYCEEVPAVVVEGLGMRQGFAGELMVVVIMGEFFDCRLVINTDVYGRGLCDRGIWE